MLIKKKRTEFETSFACDVCKKEIANLGIVPMCTDDHIEGESGAPIGYRQHFHEQCLIDFWKEKSPLK